MKKVIFLAIAAAAALTACSKSEVVDTKFNEQISFETYLGRDAQTKAPIINNDNLGNVAVYAYYTGKSGWTDQSKTNLWNGVLLIDKTGTFVSTDATAKYWANPSDKYSFFAYAPVNDKVGTVNDVNPTINFAVQPNIPDQVDLLCATPYFDKMASEFTAGTVSLNLKHALSRITVKAKATGDNFKFDVKKITLSGNFNVTGTLPLSTGNWATATPATDGSVFTFFNNNSAAYVPPTTDTATDTALPTDSYRNYAERTVEGNTVTDNYLMIIPTVPAEGATAANATLTVNYSTYYAGQESVEMSKNIEVPINFAMGKAYSINLDFSHEATEIKFSVTVDNWDETDDNNEKDSDVKPGESTPVTPAA